MRIRSILLLFAMALVSVGVQAQEEEDNNLFNHLSVGVTAGTPGVGIDVAMPACDFVQLRAGISVFPKIKFDTDLNLASYAETDPDDSYLFPSSVGIEAKVGFVTGKFLVDLYPFSGSFHITAGAYFGGSSIVKAYNTEDGLLKDVADYNARVPESERIGYELGNYLLTPDENGNVNAEIKTSSFKPYVGLGFGRAVPRNRIGFMFELGCMFWGSPKLYCNGEQLTEEDFGGDEGGVIKTLSKINIYPVINFRLCGRIL